MDDEKKANLAGSTLPIRLWDHGGHKNRSEYNTKNRAVRNNLNYKYMRMPHNGSEIYFDKLKNPSSGMFIKNVVSNPHLTEIQVRIALYLHSLCQRNHIEPILVRSGHGPSDYLFNKKIGEDGFIYYGFNEGKLPFIFHTDVIKLHDELSKIKINITADKLVETLAVLHDFSYFTVTELSWRRVDESAINGSQIPLPEDGTIYGYFIEEYSYMDTYDISKYWRETQSNTNTMK